MLDVQSTAIYFLLAFAFGMVWYRMLRRPQRDSVRMIGFPILGIAGADLGLPNSFAGGPEVMGVHIAVAFLASLVAVYVDLAVRERSLKFWTNSGAPKTADRASADDALPRGQR